MTKPLTDVLAEALRKHDAWQAHFEPCSVCPELNYGQCHEAQRLEDEWNDARTNALARYEAEKAADWTTASEGLTLTPSETAGLERLLKADPQPAPSPGVMQVAELHRYYDALGNPVIQPAPICPTCGDSGRVHDYLGPEGSRMTYPCPNPACRQVMESFAKDKPTGGTP